MAKKAASAQRSRVTGNAPLSRSRVELYALADLHLDGNNPRFGSMAGEFRGEAEILNHLVDKFGITDVISSISVNGYFESEPLVGTRKKGKAGITIVEGNRRLAACLILSGDQRAKAQLKRTSSYQELWRRNGSKDISRLPVSVFDAEEEVKELLPYLGVRHIAGSQPWDSYAKAAWVARVLDENSLELGEVAEMIGDKSRTVARILEGYYFVNQLSKESKYDPINSIKGGRGSNPEFPFSWVYTSLGYSSVREWLGMAEIGEKVEKEPISAEKLDDARDLMSFMFGDKSRSVSPAIHDSRKISNLAASVKDPERLRLLRRGKSIEDVEELSRPAQERIESGILDITESLGGLMSLISGGAVKPKDASDLLPKGKGMSTLASSVYKKLFEVSNEDEL